MSDPAAEVEYYLYTQFRNGVVFNLSAGILYGMYFAMYFVSVRVLLSYGPLRKSRANIFMFCITTSMFISGTVAIVLGSGLISQSVPFILQDIDPSFGAWSDRTTDTVTDIFAVITRLNPILSDIVCAWRAVVIWRWDRRVILILTTCILGTLAAAGYDLKLAIEVHPGSQDEQGLQEGTVALVIVGPMLGTNLLSTSLIAWKAWEYRQHVRAHLRLGSPSQRVEKLLALLIESGFIYCLIWIIYLLTAFGVLPGSGSYIVNIFMLYLSCMYPTAITIIVCLQSRIRTDSEAHSAPVIPSRQAVLTTVHFAPAGSAPSTRPGTLVSEEGKIRNVGFHERNSGRGSLV